MRVVGRDETCPLPDHPVLAAVAAALNETGQWAEVFDRDWNGVFMTDEARRMFGGWTELAVYTSGLHVLASERLEQMSGWRGGQLPLRVTREVARLFLPWVLADAAGGRDEVWERVDPRLHDIVDEVEPVAPPEAWSYVFPGIYSASGARVDIGGLLFRLRDEDGAIVGTTLIQKPARVGMGVLTRMTALVDQAHLARIDRVTVPGRRSAAILFSDLESSSRLARRLSTAAYFTLVRRLTSAVDNGVVDAGGIVGQHAGDGVVAFFLPDTAGSDSAAARGCIDAARALREAAREVAARCELRPDDVVVRVGMHWGANLYVGQIATKGRTEVTALGDSVNEAARVEACATGGRTLATKDLVERLEPGDAAALGIDLDRATYTALADLNTATEKARRDAPGLAVCEV